MSVMRITRVHSRVVDLPLPAPFHPAWARGRNQTNVLLVLVSVETDAGLICLHFGLVGCVTLSINRVTAVLLVPEVQDLLDFIALRKLLTPQTPQDCRIAGAADHRHQPAAAVRGG